MTDHPTIELLYFDGCPSHQQLLPTVEQIAAQHGAELELRPRSRRERTLLGLPYRARQWR